MDSISSVSSVLSVVKVQKHTATVTKLRRGSEMLSVGFHRTLMSAATFRIPPLFLESVVYFLGGTWLWRSDLARNFFSTFVTNHRAVSSGVCMTPSILETT